MSAEAMVAMRQARMSLIFTQPFFGRLSARLELVCDNREPTAATDGKSLTFNAGFVMSLTHEEREFLVAHEVMHCALLHPYRRGNRDRKKANVAMDYAINIILTEAGLTKPKVALLDRQYVNMSWEHIYTLLPDVESIACFGEVKDAELAPEEIEKEWQVATTAALIEATERGDCPAALQREVEQARKPKISWRDQLWYLVEAVRGADDFSYHAPNRKSAGTGVFLPSTYSEQTKPLAVVLDTSGSIDSTLLAGFLAEVRSLVDVLNPASVHFCCADAAVHAAGEWFTGDDSIEIAMAGGGGTDFRPAIKWAEELTPKVGVVLYFTDLMGAFPAYEPGVKIVWVATTNLKPPFGDVVYIN